MRYLADSCEEEMLSYYREASGRTARSYNARTGLWEGFPDDVQWFHVRMNAWDISRVSLIRNEINWIALGGYLREPLQAARWIASHPGVRDATRTYHKKMQRGHFPPFPVIMVGPPRPNVRQLVVLDGNHRVVAACMGGVIMHYFPVLIGTSAKIHRWSFYKDSKRMRKVLNPLGWANQ